MSYSFQMHKWIMWLIVIFVYIQQMLSINNEVDEVFTTMEFKLQKWVPDSIRFEFYMPIAFNGANWWFFLKDSVGSCVFSFFFYTQVPLFAHNRVDLFLEVYESLKKSWNNLIAFNMILKNSSKWIIVGRLIVKFW